MWCPGCQQDIPAISTSDGRFCCARCGGPSGRIEAAAADDLPLGAIADCGIDLAAQDPAPETPAPLLASWKIDDELRKAQQTLRAAAAWDTEPKTTASAAHRFDPPQIDLQPWHQAQMQAVGRAPLASSNPTVGRSQPPRGSALAWSVLALGLMALVCGGVLLGWSALGQRPALWNLGLPIAIGGQCALVLGLLLQLERLWQSGRYSQEKLAEVDQRLADLNTQTTILSTTHSTASKAFYSHMTEGASPQVLLADVKGQLDLLTMRLGR